MAYKPFAENVAVIIENASVIDAEDEEESAGQLTPSADQISAPIFEDSPLTIAEAKRRLALTFGVDPSAIKIIVEG